MDKKQIADYLSIGTPCHIIDVARLKSNARHLQSVAQKSNCRLILSIKGLSFLPVLSLLKDYINGFAASSLNEARLSAEAADTELHIHSPAYSSGEFEQITQYCKYIVFNSTGQLMRFEKQARMANRQIGLRINPEVSTATRPAVDPCGRHSRFGVTVENFQEELLNVIDGLHFHTMCEQYTGDLILTLNAVTERFGSYLKRVKWLNFGGGQLITADDYRTDELILAIKRLIADYGVEVILEPCEAFFLDTGCLTATVNDIVCNGASIAVLDASAVCHMPDVVSIPYRPEVLGADVPYKKRHTYILAGSTCYAGDIWGEYSFDRPLEIGSKVIFLDTAHYSIVKSNMFNGVKPPSIAFYENEITLLKQYGYDEFLMRN